MNLRTFVYAALAIPLCVLAVIAAPLILIAFTVRPSQLWMYWPVLVSFGVPQYLVFAPLLAFVARRCNKAQLAWLMLAAPVLFVPFLVTPFLFTQSSLEDLIGITLQMGGVGLAVGYVSVALAFGFWALIGLLGKRSAEERAR